MSDTLLQFFDDRYCLKPAMAAGSPTSIDVYRNDVNNFRRFIREKVESREALLADLTVLQIEAAMSWQIQRGRAKPTANKLRRHLAAIRKYAVKLGMLPPLNHNESIELIREPYTEPECWWMHEWESILVAASKLNGKVGDVPEAVFVEALLRVVYNTGARISAVMSIQTDWVDLKSGSLIIKAAVQKDDGDQRVTLLPLTIAALEKLGAHGRLSKLFDDWPYDRHVKQWPALNRMLKRLLVSAGLVNKQDEVTRRDLWHKVRRTFATYIAAKAGIAVAQSLLGHSSIEVTKRYIDKRKLKEVSVADLLIDPNPSRLRLFNPADATG